MGLTTPPRLKNIVTKSEEVRTGQILEKFSEHGKDTHHVFIDFKAAYDNIDRRRLYIYIYIYIWPQLGDPWSNSDLTNLRPSRKVFAIFDHLSSCSNTI